MQMDPMMMQHFPSERLAKAWEDLLGFEKLDIFQKFGRAAEELELARIQSVAKEQLEVEQGIPTEPPLEEEVAQAAQPQQEQGLPF
jgi:hypothetical protein